MLNSTLRRVSDQKILLKSYGIKIPSPVIDQDTTLKLKPVQKESTYEYTESPK
jgi:hypothetical protein